MTFSSLPHRENVGIARHRRFVCTNLVAFVLANILILACTLFLVCLKGCAR